MQWEEAIKGIDDLLSSMEHKRLRQNDSLSHHLLI